MCKIKCVSLVDYPRRIVAKKKYEDENCGWFAHSLFLCSCAFVISVVNHLYCVKAVRRCRVRAVRRYRLDSKFNIV